MPTWCRWWWAPIAQQLRSTQMMQPNKLRIPTCWLLRVARTSLQDIFLLSEGYGKASACRKLYQKAGGNHTQFLCVHLFPLRGPGTDSASARPMICPWSVPLSEITWLIQNARGWLLAKINHLLGHNFLTRIHSFLRPHFILPSLRRVRSPVVGLDYPNAYRPPSFCLEHFDIKFRILRSKFEWNWQKTKPFKDPANRNAGTVRQ